MEVFYPRNETTSLSNMANYEKVHQGKKARADINSSNCGTHGSDCSGSTRMTMIVGRTIMAVLTTSEITGKAPSVV